MPSITRTRASPVARSRITRWRRRRNALQPSLRRRPSGRRGRPRHSRPAREEAEETPLGAQHERRIATVERIAIGLQRAVEGEELLVLAKRVGIELYRLRVAVAAHPLGVALRLGEDDGALALGVGAHGLRRLGAFAAVLPRLLFAFGLHAGIDRLAILFRQ